MDRWASCPANDASVTEERVRNFVSFFAKLSALFVSASPCSLLPHFGIHECDVGVFLGFFFTAEMD